MNDDKYSNRELRIAVLIDADNISYTYAQAMMEEIACYGNATIKRIYGDWSRSNLYGWRATLLEYAITPCQQFAYTAGKNATDTAMIIDAMDILYAETADAFCLVSSDSDFTRLAIRLREAGKYVIGIGEQKTPDAFIATCDRFIYLEILSYMHEDLGVEAPNSSLAYLKEGAGTSTIWSPAIPSSPATPSSSAASSSPASPSSPAASSSSALPSGPASVNPPASPSAIPGVLAPGMATSSYPLDQEKWAKLITPRGATQSKAGSNLHDRGGDRQKDRYASRDRYTHPAKVSQQTRKTIRTIDATLIRLLSETVTSMGDEMGWAFLGAVGNLLLKRQPSFDSRNYGYQKLSELIDATGCFEVDHREGVGNQKLVYVRLKSPDELLDDEEENEGSRAWSENQDEPASDKTTLEGAEAKCLDKETLTKEIISKLHLEDWVDSLQEGEGGEVKAAEEKTSEAKALETETDASKKVEVQAGEAETGASKLAEAEIGDVTGSSSGQASGLSRESSSLQVSEIAPTASTESEPGESSEEAVD